MEKEQSARQASKARRRARIADADERIKNNKAILPSMRVFTEGMMFLSTKKKVSKLIKGNKLIVNASETNKKRH